MVVLTLLEKVYGKYSVKDFVYTFKSLCEGLNVNLRVLGRAPRGWIKVEVSGEDEKVAVRFLEKEVGLAPVSLERLGRFSVIRGRVLSTKSKLELPIDIGVYEPAPLEASIPLKTLQAQLADGKKLALQTIMELYCLYPNFPLEVKICEINKSEESIKVELAESQLTIFEKWLRMYNDRLVILGATIEEVKRIVARERLERDIYAVESLGLLEHAIICKMGTDAKGLIPKLGRKLPTVFLAPFCPKKVQKIIERFNL